jgi:hypothetical protein
VVSADGVMATRVAVRSHVVCEFERAFVSATTSAAAAASAATAAAAAVAAAAAAATTAAATAAAAAASVLFCRQEIDEYSLLPAPLWQAMPPVDKKTAVTIVQRFYDNAWGLDCCSALITALKIKLSDLTTLKPCIFLAIDNPSHLDRGLEEVMDRIVAGDVATKDQAAIAAIETIREKANPGLHMMQRNPDGVKGMDLFEHQIAFCQRAYSKRESEHKISDSLAYSPRTSH